MPHADLDQLLATLRTAADARMAQRRERRAQPAPAVVAAPPTAVTKAQPAPAVAKVPTPCAEGSAATAKGRWCTDAGE